MDKTWILHAQKERMPFIGYIAQLDSNIDWEVTIKPYKKKRTLSQNARYWAEIDNIVAAVAEHTGYSSQEIHEFMKQKFLKPKRVEVQGETREYYSTTKLTTQEMSDYMEAVRAWAATELGIQV